MSQCIPSGQLMYANENALRKKENRMLPRDCVKGPGVIVATDIKKERQELSLDSSMVRGHTAEKPA